MLYNIIRDTFKQDVKKSFEHSLFSYQESQHCKKRQRACLSYYCPIIVKRRHDQDNIQKTACSWGQHTVSEVESMTIIVGSMATGRPGTAAGAESLHLICREKEAGHGGAFET